MINLSLVQALSIWSELEAAYHGKNGFGGDTAEIYMYRLMPCSPAADRPVVGSSFHDIRVKRICDANRSLYAILKHFLDTHDDVRLLVDARRFGKWVAVAGQDHRVHVRVVHKRGRR